ncbi:MAG: hypothetical protein ETSY1_29380 [Candidatus Entotheonella factor]|uniref:DUF3179 domain-containing protein n=1 Tax=Entotheonella factor TaxID=1429438 RepID=W4LCN2_ENTF1|nr:MAG: hypothetical protein ETSY1_29380 [Candidatus Entotheonella factor]
MIDGQAYTFGVSGKLWRNGLVMYDHQTETLWSGVTGEALRGKLQGKQLEILAAQPKVRWDEWKKTYPESKVLTLYGFQDLDEDNYADYHFGPMTGVVPVTHRDDRLHPKAKVMAIRIGEQARAYPLALFNQETKLLTDRVADQALVVYRDNVSEASAVFGRSVDGQELNFKAGNTWTTLEDMTTGSTWNIVTGKAIAGPLKGKTLERVPHYEIYWFGFADFFPQATLFGENAKN